MCSASQPEPITVECPPEVPDADPEEEYERLPVYVERLGILDEAEAEAEAADGWIKFEEETAATAPVVTDSGGGDVEFGNFEGGFGGSDSFGAAPSPRLAASDVELIKSAMAALDIQPPPWIRKMQHLQAVQRAQTAVAAACGEEAPPETPLGARRRRRVGSPLRAPSARAAAARKPLARHARRRLPLRRRIRRRRKLRRRMRGTGRQRACGQPRRPARTAEKGTAPPPPPPPPGRDGQGAGGGAEEGAGGAAGGGGRRRQVGHFSRVSSSRGSCHVDLCAGDAQSESSRQLYVSRCVPRVWSRANGAPARRLPTSETRWHVICFFSRIVVCVHVRCAPTRLMCY
ncbi:hypothetical protein EMIHUDRAFT_441142 [Emiliania huxleyi CCMP1516]|uniref:PSP proline-rich domain-containing protein n=2 Tax=Emiliania huxleyi TaxID=2903 RepID=A0A0D3KGJ2_EMIH1|nr:hypothetical protein EMIHUDRAFT_441142 [Emiliania huxleyi CCMP1516]EOD34877.1 hypothetical protein EMIHUDRAFT_441142 [Emiliania huxleyi CCMP1516]|eukprot:XP_005787306.1 hypothetical protein EMIHUDRAFT_441142 [Emiliania huxleyi CCMP1516]